MSAPAMPRNRAPGTLRRWGQAVLNVLYPVRCPACRKAPGAGSENGDFCAACRAEMRPVEAPFCQRCSEPFRGEITGDFLCPNCGGLHQAYDFAVCPWLSRGPVREVIHRLKYERAAAMRLPLALLMAEALDDPRLANIPWLLVPVPLHPRRERERGYNQSAELARTIARLSGLPCRQALQRVRSTGPQAKQDRAGRLQNLHGAFAVARSAAIALRDASILLIDDVLTTGATAHECAATLKKAGAAKVAVLTAARG